MNKKCQLCQVRVVYAVCRRCGKKVCEKCSYHHGLCVRCAKDMGRKR
ncbi:hypothetical protein [Candidatus Hecatella orcuttiae]|nr:hypothetical protein [Candidatus Hecatella orcuttiae]